MLLDCFTCPHEVVEYNEDLLNSLNQETEAFIGTKFLLDLEAFSRIEGVLC